ncbi:hypothetical protein OS175_11630 [Marinicella sp. S1101]|uniref:DUF6768 family protein n=1 Tax=Marinicella marina TaxID=2996016 RepID=UPI0022608B33|nr:DUF6768 family protein [Marinicella marina]MCX7554532.1 hypothetical protein [Marinicella marina]MDJ1141084.1 hypothetical protein [Marinicella marina]
MNIDEQIKQALEEEINEIRHDHQVIDANPFKQMKASFKGEMGWMYLLVMAFTTLFALGAFYCVYEFYHAQELKPLLAWAVGIIVLTLLTQISKMWYWSEMGHNRVIREVKVLELQVARLNERVKS